MNFPSKILPNSSYKYINCDLSDHYLIRSTKAGNISEILDPITGFIKQEHICSPTHQVADLSTSLLGIFEISHIQIQLTSNGKTEYNHYCEPNIDVEVPIYQDHFEIDSDKFYWVVLIRNLNNVLVDYTKSNLPFTAECVVMHTPMKWNYWHFSIRWQTDEGFAHSLSDKERKKLLGRLGQEARSHIAMFATIKEPNYFELDPSEYMA